MRTLIDVLLLLFIFYLAKVTADDGYGGHGSHGGLGGYGHGGHGGVPVKVVPIQQATYHQGNGGYNDNDKDSGIWKALTKGVANLFKQDDKEDDRYIPPPKPQVIEVKVPQCDPLTNYITTVITESIPVPVTQTQFIESIVPSILRQTQYEIQTETQMYTTILTQDRLITTTKSIIVPRISTYTQIDRQTVTSNIIQRQTDVVFTPILSVSTTVVTDTAYVTQVVPTLTTIVSTFTKTEVSNQYITTTLVERGIPETIYATKTAIRKQAETTQGPYPSFGVPLPSAARNAPVPPAQAKTITSFVTSFKPTVEYVTETKYVTETEYETKTTQVTQLQPQYFTTTEHVVQTETVKVPSPCEQRQAVPHTQIEDVFLAIDPNDLQPFVSQLGNQANSQAPANQVNLPQEIILEIDATDVLSPQLDPSVNEIGPIGNPTFGVPLPNSAQRATPSLNSLGVNNAPIALATPSKPNTSQLSRGNPPPPLPVPEKLNAAAPILREKENRLKQSLQRLQSLIFNPLTIK